MTLTVASLLTVLNSRVSGIGLHAPRSMMQLRYIYGDMKSKQLDDAEYALQKLSQQMPFQSSLTMRGRRG